MKHLHRITLAIVAMLLAMSALRMQRPASVRRRPNSNFRTKTVSGMSSRTTAASGLPCISIRKTKRRAVRHRHANSATTSSRSKKPAAQILGVSVDDVESHKKFAEKHGLPFPILADPTKATAKKYGVLKSYLGTMELAKRETFLIDPQGNIVKRYVDVDPKGHSQIVLKDIKELQRRAATRPAASG